MRAIRKTTITFGLVSVPVSLFKATDEHGSYKMHQYHCHDDGSEPGRINLLRRCAACAEEVAYGDIAKGAEVDDQVVIITDEDLNTVERQAVHGVNVELFTDANTVPVSLLRDVYFLAPVDQAAVQGYTLLRQVMADANQVAVVKFSLRNDAVKIGVVRADGDVLTLTSMVWPEDVRTPDFKLLKQTAEVPPKMLAAANMLVESMAGEFNPDDYRDEYVAAVGELVAAKASGQEITVEAPEAEAEVGDLLAKLQASVAARGGKKVA